MGLEFLGKTDQHSVLEVMILAAKSLKTIDSDYLLEISQMQYIVHLLEELNLTEQTRLELLESIRTKNITGITETAQKAELDEAVMELLKELPFLYGDMAQTIKKAAKMALNDKMRQDIEELKEYCSTLKSLGYAKNIQLDLSMVNDLDYYNGIVFRGYIRSLPGCVLAGGQYDNTMQQLGKTGGAVGFAIYLDELNKGKQPMAQYDVDALLLYETGDSMLDVAKAVNTLQKQGLTVRGETGEPEGLRYRERYLLKDGQPVKEEK